jgi:hypothetical protein
MLILCALFGTFLIIAASRSITGYFGAPWIPTPIWVVDSMVRMANLKQGGTLLDLGDGDGHIVIWAAHRFKAKAIGVEIDLSALCGQIFLFWSLVKANALGFCVQAFIFRFLNRQML